MCSERSEFTSTANIGFNGGYLNKETVLVYVSYTAVKRKCKAVPPQIKRHATKHWVFEAYWKVEVNSYGLTSGLYGDGVIFMHRPICSRSLFGKEARWAPQSDWTWWK